MDKDARIAELEALLKKALQRIAELEALLPKNSRNSHMPPSSDITKPKPAKKKRPAKKRKPGPRKGHKANFRAAFPPEEVDAAFVYTYPDLDPQRYQLQEGVFSVEQQVELRERPFVVTEHRFQHYLDTVTGRIVRVPRPDELKHGLFGPRLLALTSCLKADLHASYAAIQTLLHDAMGLKVSSGHLVNATGRVSAALGATYQALLQRVIREPVIHVDETGHKECGERMWTWGMTNPVGTVFKIDPSRSSGVLFEMLGQDFEGTIVSDYFGAYLKCGRGIAGMTHQFCWAHLIRELRYAGESPDRRSRNWAAKVLHQVKRMFRAWHRRHLKACGVARDAILKLCRHPGSGETPRKLGGRVWASRAGYFRFLSPDAPAVEPTNNPAERALRAVVLHRKVTQGTRGESGRQWTERVFSVRATCRQHGESLFSFLVQALEAKAQGTGPPELAGVR